MSTCAGCLIGRECLRPATCDSGFGLELVEPPTPPKRSTSERRPSSSSFDEAAYIAEHLPKLLAAVLARSNRTVESTRYGRSQT